jgi:hypothetical protein
VLHSIGYYRCNIVVWHSIGYYGCYIVVLHSIGYYRCCIPHYSKVAAPLNGLLKNSLTWEWGGEQQTAFDTLRRNCVHRGRFWGTGPKQASHIAYWQVECGNRSSTRTNWWSRKCIHDCLHQQVTKSFGECARKELRFTIKRYVSGCMGNQKVSHLSAWGEVYTGHRSPTSDVFIDYKWPCDFAPPGQEGHHTPAVYLWSGTGVNHQNADLNEYTLEVAIIQTIPLNEYTFKMVRGWITRMQNVCPTCQKRVQQILLVHDWTMNLR